MWKYYALLSALFAGMTAVLAKIGIKGVPSNVATAVRTLVILFVAFGIIIATGEIRDIRSIGRRSLLFLVLSGIATGLSWIMYFKALELGPVSKVAPIDKLSVAVAIGLSVIFLNETVDWKTLAGAGLIIAGTIVLIR
ncbi:EamA family transporter [Chitinophaga caseinilytica]|uniref:EamA family transporter n=1 Tax=Chitinophaga caseinilytica TaxID=2267521 RepID=A0ABZ2YZT9_9BACT